MPARGPALHPAFACVLGIFVTLCGVVAYRQFGPSDAQLRQSVRVQTSLQVESVAVAEDADHHTSAVPSIQNSTTVAPLRSPAAGLWAEGPPSAVQATGQPCPEVHVVAVPVQQPGSKDSQQQAAPVVCNRKKDYILIYTYGKVGSSTLQDALSRWMHPEKGQGQAIALIPYQVSEALRQHRGLFTHGPHVVRDFRQRWTKPGDTIWVVTAVRSPWVHQMSSFYEKIIDRLNPERQEEYRIPYSMEELHAMFRKARRTWVSEHQHWFSRMFRTGTGVNLLENASAYDHLKKRLFVQHVVDDRILNIVLLHLEDADQWEDILNEFFPGVTVGAKRTSENRWYQDSYHDFKKTFVFDHREIRELLSYEQWYFYSPSEAMRLHTAAEGPLGRNIGHKRGTDRFRNVAGTADLR
eukprot:TRINITY_DN121877_c0_g1_i1.p1 TRINITY_DN121877_c0_g1~~TRINITY_DN121877_c0_g1_i1.p1  ORF type:complete len:410 (+),score=53.96 TRINITY_DN121877_c0_g1_i1:86-1315(+)